MVEINTMSFSNWLEEAGLNSSTIESLQNSDYNSIDVLKECRNDDINEISASLNIHTLQKLKLKSALRHLHENELNKHKIISNTEQHAILDLTNVSNKLQTLINDINVEHNEYDKELKKFEVRIDNEFDLLFEQLTKQKRLIKTKLYEIVKDKKKRFENKKLQYEKEKEDINKTKTQCHQLLNDAIEIEKLDERKHEICKMTKNILNGVNHDQCKNMPYYKPLQKIHFFDMLSRQTLISIQNLDIIAKCILFPKLLLLSNSCKNHIILLKWYINEKTDEQIKIEWVKIDNDEKKNEKNENDYDWNYKLTKNGNMQFGINVKQNGAYLCRISYFNIYLKQNLMSNTMSISIKCNVLWDVFRSGNDVSFVGNKAKLFIDCWRTLFAKEIINVTNYKKHKIDKTYKTKYQYRLKIHSACDKGGGFMIGIIPNNNINANMTRSFTRYGGYAINKGGLLFPGGRRYTNVTWRDGDIIDTYVNINTKQQHHLAATLSFAYNGINLGIAFRNLPKQKYRFALTLLYQNDQVELIDLNNTQ